MRKKYVFLNNYLLRCLNIGKNILKQETRSPYLRIILFKCCKNAIFLMSNEYILD